MNRSLKCQCGTVQGQLKDIEKSRRIVCYCKDCQAFAHYLGKAGSLLDEQGGSNILVSQPQQLEFTAGVDAIASMSLSERGMLRWYASCCNTPIGNTPRTRAMSFIGLSPLCLADHGNNLDSDFGPVRMVSFTEGAKGKVAGTGIRALPVMIGLGVALLRSRLSGRYRGNLFFKADTGEPIVAPTVLAKAEHERLRALG